MKIGIMSDTHDNLHAVGAALSALAERKVELIIHAGDFVAPFAVRKLLSANLAVLAVFGNCDGERKVISELLPDIAAGARHERIDGKKFVIVHSMDWLKPNERKDADVIVCGHTHKHLIEPGRPMVINPGECGGWVTGQCTAAVLDTETLCAEIIEVGKT